jgi:hypothetical protein
VAAKLQVGCCDAFPRAFTDQTEWHPSSARAFALVRSAFPVLAGRLKLETAETVPAVSQDISSRRCVCPHHQPAVVVVFVVVVSRWYSQQISPNAAAAAAIAAATATGIGAPGRLPQTGPPVGGIDPTDDSPGRAAAACRPRYLAVRSDSFGRTSDCCRVALSTLSRRRYADSGY